MSAFTQPGGMVAEPDSAAGIRALLTGIITEAAANAPRSRQAVIGPSEVGDPCPRRLAYKLLDWPTVADGGDPWPSIVGTATHDWLAQALTRHNESEPGRFLVEARVTVDDGTHAGFRLAGSCDAYDTRTNTVIDHKIVGDTAMRRYKTEGVREQYRVQANLYALGFENGGYKPETVALAFYPRGGMLAGLWVWTDVYDRQVALDALQRLGSIRDLVLALDPESRPDMWGHIPATPSSACRWCPWFAPGATDLSTGCPGQLTPTQAN